MAINETISTGRKHRLCIDNTPGNKRWIKMSFWGKASDIEMNDGTTVESKIGNFKGVTTNINQVAGYAADITLLNSVKATLTNLITSLTNLVNNINSRLGGLRFYEDANGNKWVIGADSVAKKLGSLTEDNILCWAVFKNRNKSISEGESNYWVRVSEFDLSIVEGYQDFILGDNIMIQPSYIATEQENFVYPSFIHLTAQSNSTNITYDNINLDTYRNMNRNVLDVETLPSGQPYVGKNMHARYNPTTGKLFVVIGATATIQSITLYKI